MVWLPFIIANIISIAGLLREATALAFIFHCVVCNRFLLEIKLYRGLKFSAVKHTILHQKPPKLWVVCYRLLECVHFAVVSSLWWQSPLLWAAKSGKMLSPLKRTHASLPSIIMEGDRSVLESLLQWLKAPPVCCTYLERWPSPMRKARDH